VSEPQAIGIQQRGGTDVRASIARAAQATGVDFNYLLAQAKLESSLDPTARAGTSSAAGLYQFTRGTWLQTLDRHGAEHGMDWAGSAIDGGQVSDPGMRAQIMALRYNADASALMAAELANDNKMQLTQTLGREPDASELYLAHFLGIGGAQQFLSALQTNPGQSAAGILPKAAAANRSIFYDAGGSPRSVSGVMDVLRGKVNGAMDGGMPPMDWAMQGGGFDPGFGPGFGMAGIPGAYPGNFDVAAAQSQPQPTGSPVAQEFHAARQQVAAQGNRPSMADTLRNTFGVSGGGASGTGGDGRGNAPDFVRAAYDKLRSFNL